VSVVAPEDEVRIRLRGAAALLEVAIDMAQRDHPEASIQLGVLAVYKEGGKVAITLDPTEFLADLRRLVGHDDAI
jgi:hypothetical protein